MEIKLTAQEENLFGLIYKYWFAEASEQEIMEDIADLEEWEFPIGFTKETLLSAIIKDLDPEFIIGEDLAKLNFYILQIEG